jgi:quercetin dioxygenase-like cupin family protein
MPERQSAVHVKWAEVPVEAMNPNLDRQFLSGEHLTLARVVLRKGSVVARHSHANEQMAQLLSGCMKFVLFEDGVEQAGREVVLRPEEVLVIPPHVPHEVHVLEDSVNLDIFAPPRVDWMSGEDAYLRG